MGTRSSTRAAAFAFLLLPGTAGPQDRHPVDPLAPPFDAVARINVPGISRCTGAVVAPGVAVTAAHCLTKPGLGHFVGPGSVHILLGYDRGRFARHIVPDQLAFPPGADPSNRIASTADFVVMRFGPHGGATLPLGTATPGTAVLLPGYNQDRAERLEIGPPCTVTVAGDFLRHDCDGTRGSSGGPLIGRAPDGTARFVGLQVAGFAGLGGLAIPAAAIRPYLSR